MEGLDADQWGVLVGLRLVGRVGKTWPGQDPAGGKTQNPEHPLLGN